MDVDDKIYLVVAGVSSFCLLSRFLQILLKPRDSLLVFICLVLENLLCTLGVVSSGGRLVQLGHCSDHLLLSLFKILFKARNPPGQSIHLKFRRRQRLFLLLELQGGDAELLNSQVQLGLKLPCLRHQLLHLVLSL